MRSKLVSRFEWGALDDEQPKILRCRNPCGLGEGRKQRWDGQTHGRGLGLLMIDPVVMLGRLRQPSWTFEFGEIRTRSVDV